MWQGSSWLGTGHTTPSSEAGSGESGRSSRSGKSRIPRPVSLPKRLEDKLSIRAARSPLRAASAGQSNTKQLSARPPLKSPIKPQVPPRPKSRVRDTVKLFDAKSNKALRKSPGPGVLSPGGGGGGGAVRLRRSVKPVSSAPKTGGGEGMVECDPFR